MQNILINLNTISKIKPGNKIFINNEDYISIETDSIIQCLTRFVYNNSRTKNLSDLTHFYIRVFEQLILIITKLSFSNIDSNTRSDYENNLDKIKQYLGLSMHGLENLKKTYISDTLTCSKLDIIISDIQFNIKKIEKYETYKQKNKTFNTKELNELKKLKSE